MILYKYVSFEAGLKILETSSLGFSHLEDFNDPFECTGLGVYDLDVPLSTAIDAFRNRFSRKYVILSMTRTPLNPLMWSHYAHSHKGIVIGIDVKRAGLDDEQQFIIPCTKGEIRYLNTVPKNVNKVNTDDLMSAGDSNKLNWNAHESLLKHALLYKMKEWGYEEEVRIVKNISGSKFSYHSSTYSEAIIDGILWRQINIGMRPIYLFEIPRCAIVEIYIGKNTFIDQRRKQELSQPVLNHSVDKFEYLKTLCHQYNIDLYSVRIDMENWVLKRKRLTCDS